MRVFPALFLAAFTVTSLERASAQASDEAGVRDSGDLSQVIAIDTVNAAGLFLHPTGKSLTSTPAGPMLQLGNVAEFDIRRGPAPTSELVRRFVYEPSRPEQE